jgi:PAS domain S-box-containing protein
MALFRKYQQLRLDIKRIAYVLKHSITKRLLVVVFSIYLIITIGVTLVHMDFEYEFSKRQTVAALKNIQAMIHNSISQAIWEFNTPQIDTILHGLFSNAYVVGVKLIIPQNDTKSGTASKQIGLVESDTGELIYVDPETQQVQLVTNTFERLIPDEFPIEHVDSLNRKLTIGTMYIYSSNKVVFSQVRDSFILIIINALIKTIALWIFFLWAGYYFISKPLAQLTEAIKQLSEGNWNTQLISKTGRKNQKTEINTLFETFNETAHNLRVTEDKLRNSRNRLNTIFDTMPSALASINSKNIIQGWNKDITQITGIESKNAVGHNLTDVFPAFADYMYLITEALKNKDEAQVQHVKLACNADTINHLYHITVYPLLAITPPELVIRIDDVTEQVKNEAGLAQVEKLASVGASIAGVAHEINNPLATVLLNTQNILRRIDPSMESNLKVAEELQVDLLKQYKYLEQREIIKFITGIHDAGQRASSIVKNMLKFTRRSTADMEKHNLTEIINDALQLCASDISIQEHIDFKELHVETNFQDPNIEIECYPLEIQQVILNLVRNAVQALNPTQASKHVKISLSKVGENKVSLEITDTGHGMSNEVLEQIFQPFFTTKPVGQGTGLGLSVCRNIIVQKHHGNLEVQSAPGQGTTFIITLPIIQAK